MNPLAADPFDRSASDVVLIVDDVPDNLSVLHDALDEAGYTVLVATHGDAALQRATQAQPDVVLLDAVMPGMDGFEVARRLKASPATAHIPIIFMTGLTDTEHVVAAFQAGGVDYVTKPIRPREVIARLVTHLQGARLASQARHALDAFGHATLAVRLGDGRVTWQTPLAREFLQVYLGCEQPLLPPPVLDWLRQAAGRHHPGAVPEVLTRTLADGRRRLVIALHEPTGDDEWLLVLREASDAAAIEALTLAFRLTSREAEVLYWVVQGKTNRDIGEILGASPATVKKHLEHVFEKLGVETRTAAANVAVGRVPQLGRR
ncbi:MAG TPA: response regulator transcription factor [Burkholderiaceae bacterium]|nr:response regulator transcription factor [Burkholderiaceae bacterium]